jgi:hypothetical protein
VNTWQVSPYDHDKFLFPLGLDYNVHVFQSASTFQIEKQKDSMHLSYVIIQATFRISDGESPRSPRIASSSVKLGYTNIILVLVYILNIFSTSLCGISVTVTLSSLECLGKNIIQYRCHFSHQWYSKMRPKKCVFRVTRPTLFFHPNPKTFNWNILEIASSSGTKLDFYVWSFNPSAWDNINISWKSINKKKTNTNNITQSHHSLNH